MSTDLPDRLPLGGFVDDQLRDAAAAIRQEIAASAGREDLVELIDGRLVGAVGADRIWSFAVSTEVAPPADSPGQLRVLRSPAAEDGSIDGIGVEPVPVDVLAVGDDSLVLSTRAGLGQRIESADLTLDPGFVYRKLLGRLDELVGTMTAGDGGLFDQLVLPDAFESDSAGGGPEMDRPDPDLDQRRAASRAVEPGLRFTWGPPGTGKTKVLAMAVAEAARRGDRVLVLAHANAAVDVAIDRIASELADDDEFGPDLLEDGKVLRVGTPQSAAVLVRPQVLPEQLAESRDPAATGRLAELTDQRRQLSNQMRAASDPAERATLSAQLDAVRIESKELRRELKAVASGLVDEAAVVATTLSRAVIDDQLWLADWDVVVIDEASMAPLPFVLAFCLGDATTLSIFGDFRQLPPICVSTEDAAHRWFGRDVFEFGGVVEAHELGLVDPRLSVLRTQFRMGEQICESVNQFVYGGVLRTHLAARDAAIRLAELDPGSGAELVLVDTSSLGALALTEAQADSFSRVNPLAAALASSIAGELVGQGCAQVGLISPYRAQTQWTRALVGHLDSADAATIHRFQGSERDAIVFDLTDGPGFPGPSQLTGGDADRARRLFNVAVSRARGKLVVLADLDFVEQRFPLGSPFPVLLQVMESAGAERMDAAELVAALTSDADLLRIDPPGAVRWSASWVDAVTTLIADGASGDGLRSLDLNVPDESINPEQLAELVGAAESTGVAAGVRVRCSPATARAVEHTDAELRLLVAGSFPWAVVDESTVVVGATVPNQPAAVASGTRVVTAFRRSIAPR